MKTPNEAQKQLVLDTNMSFLKFSVVSAFEVWHGQKTCLKNICLTNMSSIMKNLLKSRKVISLAKELGFHFLQQIGG